MFVSYERLRVMFVCSIITNNVKIIGNLLKDTHCLCFYIEKTKTVYCH